MIEIKPLITKEQRIIKDHFEKRVNKASQKSMIDFLTDHFRYHTMNSWNQSTSYAHNIKLSHLPLPNDIGETAWSMLDCQEWQDHMSDLMHNFDMAHNHEWQVGINGRSNGYIVLYQGGIKNNQPFVQSGRSLDQGEDFQDWDIDDLQDRVDIVHDFDMLVRDIVMDFGAFCRSYDVVNQVISVPKTIKCLREKS